MEWLAASGCTLSFFHLLIELPAELGLPFEHGEAVTNSGSAALGFEDEACLLGVVYEVVAEVFHPELVGVGPRGGGDVGVHAHGGGVDDEQAFGG